MITLSRIIRLKGVWIPLLIGILFILIYSLATAETYRIAPFTISSLENLYNYCFIFIAIPLYFLNKINFQYSRAGFESHEIKVLQKLYFLFSFALLFTLLTSVITLILFHLWKVDFADVELIPIFSYMLLYAIQWSLIFNFTLNIKNSSGYLFLLYMSPILRFFSQLFEKDYQFDVSWLFPFASDISNHNIWTYVVYTILFLFLSVKTHKSYYF